MRTPSDTGLTARRVVSTAIGNCAYSSGPNEVKSSDHFYARASVSPPSQANFQRPLPQPQLPTGEIRASAERLRALGFVQGAYALQMRRVVRARPVTERKKGRPPANPGAGMTERAAV